MRSPCLGSHSLPWKDVSILRCQSAYILTLRNGSQSNKLSIDSHESGGMCLVRTSDDLAEYLIEESCNRVRLVYVLDVLRYLHVDLLIHLLILEES